MASTHSFSLSSITKSPISSKQSILPPKRVNLSSFNPPFSTFRVPKTTRTKCSSSTTGHGTVDAAMSIDNLKRFFDINVGNWFGSFHQFDGNGNLLQNVNTKLAVSTYGESELISLIQTLYIKQAQSSTSFSGDDEEPEWAEYRIKETNVFTADKYQQIGFFINERAFSLRYQTAGMLESVLRQGVLGEDDTGEESPKNLKLPSRRPSIVCESCLYSKERDRRARAFHIMDPQGFLDMLLIFMEDKGDGVHFPPALADDSDNTDRLVPFLGKWKGHSITKRSGLYGATIAEADTTTVLEIDDKGQLFQGISSKAAGQDAPSNVRWTGTISGNVITFDGGYQLTLLPGGMYMGWPCDIAKSVAEYKSFHLEFGWVESPGKKQKLVRTFDMEGLAVSTTYFSEIKL